MLVYHGCPRLCAETETGTESFDDAHNSPVNSHVSTGKSPVEYIHTYEAPIMQLSSSYSGPFKSAVENLIKYIIKTP